MYACSQRIQPVTFALISYSYAPASTSAIRPPPEIAWVFQRAASMATLPALLGLKATFNSV